MRSTKALIVFATLALFAASTGTAAAIPKHAVARSAVPFGAPKGYTIVHSGSIAAPNATQTSGTVTCPGTTVPLGGGAVIASSSLYANLPVSEPYFNFGWFAVVNNASGADTTFTLYAVCAHKPKGYVVKTSASAPNPAGAQSRASLTCPAKHKLLGGGGASDSGYLSVDLNSSFPSSARTWTVDMNNPSPQNSTITVEAICAKPIKGYKLIVGPSHTNGAGAEDAASVDCPSPSVALDGGVQSNATNTAVNMNSTYPVSSTEWNVFENNADTSDHSLTPYVICAGTH